MKLILIIAIFLFSTFQAFPQPCPGTSPACEDECGGNPCDNNACIACLEGQEVPIDGGLSWLLLAGVGIAGNHIRKKRKGKKTNE